MISIDQFKETLDDQIDLIDTKPDETLPIWLTVTADYEPNDYDSALRRPLNFD